MFDKLIKWSLEQRVLVLSITLILFLLSLSIFNRLTVDVFPDITAPTVTILTESHGMAPEEVEKLVSFPIETAVNGASGVRRVRSSSATGISIVWVEFDWDTDIITARQIVNEKLQIAKSSLLTDASNPIIAPMSSIMGEILLVSISNNSKQMTNMELRTFADWTIRPQLMGIKGVSQVIPIGGEVKQYQILVSQQKLTEFGLSTEDIVQATLESNLNASGGKFINSGQEYVIRGVGRVETIKDIELTFITNRDNKPVLIKDIAEVIIGSAIKTGDASFNSKPSIIMSVLKQPNINTLDLTEKIDERIVSIQKMLPEDVNINTNVFRQSDFINVSISNVIESLLLGAFLVVIILLIFLANIRTTFISLMSIPISLSITILIFYLLDMSINTMTLGGIAIAIGALVDDAIIDVENVYRRLKENAELSPDEKKANLLVIFEASKEIRSSMVNATLIIMIVFLPLFFLSGVEGRLLIPMGFAYLTSISISLLVAVMVTPVLCYYLLPNSLKENSKESWIVRNLQKVYKQILNVILNRSSLVLIVTGIVLLITLSILPFLGRAFLPGFNEGSLTINLTTAVGTSLEESNNIGQLAERLLLSNEHVLSVARRTGRSELDEHAQSVSASELDVRINIEDISKESLVNKLRQSLAALPGTNVTFGQPIGHRIDHMLSGTKANIAVKIFGDDLFELQKLSEKIKTEVEQVNGAVDVNVEEKNNAVQFQIKYNRKALALFGISVQDLSHGIDIAFMGEKVSKVLEGQKNFDLVIRYSNDRMNDIESIRNTLFDTKDGKRIPLFQLADIQFENGPNNITRENVKRKMVVQANVSNRDLISVVNDIKQKIDKNIVLPFGYFIEYGGQFESEERASKILLVLSIVSIFIIMLILYQQFGTIKLTLFIMLNLPLSLIGGIWAIFLTDKIISIASLVGFITLYGIATRNGILLISHYQYLLNKGKNLKEAVIQGSIERLNPILMTALTAMFALIPLALGQGESGKEIEAPMAIVILGGLITATILNMIVIPTLYYKYTDK